MTRNETIYQMRRDGHTYSEIAKTYNLSIERIRQICRKVEFLQSKQARFPWFRYKDKTDRRIFNAICRKYGEISKEEFLAFDADYLASYVRNIGAGSAKRIKEIQDELRTNEEVI